MATMRTLAPNPQGEHNDPEWYGTQSKRLLPLIQITKSGSIKVNKRLREELPAYFQVKYTPGERELFLRESSKEEGGIRLNAPNTKLLPISRKIHRDGIPLPAYFEMHYQPQEQLWRGKLLKISDEMLLETIQKIKRESSEQAARESEAMEEILQRHGAICESLINICGKSIKPKSDRRIVACLGLVEAALCYEPALCTFEEHAWEYVRNWLVLSNKRYVPAAANERYSADQLGQQEEVSVYDLLTGSNDGGLADWEDRQEIQNFAATLNDSERKMFQMVLENGTISQIAAEFGLEESHVRSKLMDLVVKWRLYSNK